MKRGGRTVRRPTEYKALRRVGESERAKAREARARQREARILAWARQQRAEVQAYRRAA